ncbi:SPOR domain-containing protein [Formosa sp. S-31]|uniref:SPOR domain-containing protein n=1 Tax=Formosa sp. S-31 TaxID=2790949 RepID=UPI003EBDF405
MKLLKFKISTLALAGVLLISTKTFAQEGSVALKQDKKITRLLEVKQQMDKDENASNRYKIQIYSGKRAEAEKVQKEYNQKFDKWNSTLVYETPNYKIWVGSFRTRLEADRALLEIKESFSNGFIFKPKKTI